MAESGLESLEKQNELFKLDDVPEELRRATLRMEFPPSYVLVGIHRLFTDKNLYEPAWDKCKHGVQRGALVGAAWAVLTFGIQERFIKLFLKNSPRIAGLSGNTLFGYPIPFNLYTYATLIYVGQEITFILRFFLSKNIRIARDRAWKQTVESRGKGPDFWQPYVEEWEQPPKVDLREGFVSRMLGGWLGMYVLRRVISIPMAFYPLLGTLAAAWFRAQGKSRYLHRGYFEAKKMSKQQIAVHIEERKWSYLSFGFAAALLEGLPIIGLLFTVSNRIGAAMWAFDLEKRQHYIANEKRLKAAKKN